MSDNLSTKINLAKVKLEVLIKISMQLTLVLWKWCWNLEKKQARSLATMFLIIDSLMFKYASC